jgi:CBS domain-containing protein
MVGDNLPVAVVDDRGRLAGVITRGALMGGLAARERIEKEEEETYL